jgi:pimeloyl-ACP methyl ester carboxylesterase
VSDLEVRGGVTSVETEALLAEALRLSAAAHIVEEWATRAGALRLRLDELGLDGTGWGAGLAVDTAQAGFVAAGRSASDLAHALLLSGSGYAATETLAAGLAEAGRRLAAGLLGVAAPTLPLAGVSAAAITLGPAARVSLFGALIAPREHAAAVDRLVREHGLPILSDPAFVGLVRSAADTADEFLAGLFRSQALFAAGGALEAPENANVLLAAAGVVGLLTGSRALRETEVTVTDVTTRADHRSVPSGSATPPPVRGVGDLAARIPPSEPGAPQIRIERYDTADGTRWIVYSGGTVDFGLTPAGEPYDMTANLHGAADASILGDLVGLPVEAAASERAVRAAMAEAGVGGGEPVIVVGHSAGGMVAANLAADPGSDLEVAAAVSLGGPAHVATGDTPVLSVAHSEDFVPATAGSGVHADGRIEVERSIGTLPPDEGDSVPAHALQQYQGTARAIDRADDPRLREFRDLVAGFTGGRPPTDVSLWHAQRTS